MAGNSGVIITIVVFCLIFAWIITFSILAMALKKPIFTKLSLIAPIGYKIYAKSMRLGTDALKKAEVEGRENRIQRSIDEKQKKLQKLTGVQSQSEPQTTGGYYYDDIDPDF